jgi:hypothetical protein
MKNNLLSTNQTNTAAIAKAYTISEITEKYKKLNEDLVFALDQFDIIFENEYLDSSDIKIFIELDITFEELTINAEEIRTHGELIYTSILETVFEESLDKAKKLFGFNDSDFWYIKLESYNKLIIKIGVEVSFVLKFLNKLFNTLRIITQLCDLSENNELERFEKFDFADTMNYFDFDEIVKKANKITDLQDRLNFYHNEIAEKELHAVQYNEDSFVLDMCTEFTHKCNRAIEITENLLCKSTIHKHETPVKLLNNGQLHTNIPDESNMQPGSNQSNETEFSPETIAKQNPAFTTSRQVLAIYYLLNEIDHKGINQIDKTNKAKFIEFLTGKNYNNIYKTLSNPFKGLDKKNPKSFLNDVEYIKMHFENLGLKSIVQKINADTQPDE